MSAAEAHEPTPFIDYENLPAPTEGILVTPVHHRPERCSVSRVLLRGPRRPGGAGGEPVHRQARQLIGADEPGRCPPPPTSPTSRS